jgi:hypothetical protein
VDRLLSNPGIDVDELSKRWVNHAVGSRSNIVVAMDWTDFDVDNQATIMLSLVTLAAALSVGIVLSDACAAYAPSSSTPMHIQNLQGAAPRRWSRPPAAGCGEERSQYLFHARLSCHGRLTLAAPLSGQSTGVRGLDRT